MSAARKKIGVMNMTKQIAKITPIEQGRSMSELITSAVLEIISNVQKSSLKQSEIPHIHAQRIANGAASKAAMVAGSLALPPGPAGWITILPELLMVWRIQAKMVADIAAVYGKSGSLTPESLIYCLFRHAAAQATRDIVVRIGERTVVKKMSASALQKTAMMVGLKITQKSAARVVGRWVPVLGAAAVAGYAAYDTKGVAKKAVEIYSA